MNDRPRAPYVVFTRSDSPYFWVRFSIPGQGQKRIPLKTRDEQDAKRRAEVEYQRAIWSAEQGLLPGKMSFDRIARLYLDSAEREAGDHPVKRAKVSADRGVLERYMLPFFGRSPVTAINAPKLHNYMGWRKFYWTSGPGAEETHITYERQGRKVIRPALHIEATLSTLCRDPVTLRSEFKHAVRLGYLRDADIPKIDLTNEERNKRPSFTDDEVDRLMKIAEERMILYCFIGIPICPVRLSSIGARVVRRRPGPRRQGHLARGRCGRRAPRRNADHRRAAVSSVTRWRKSRTRPAGARWRSVARSVRS